MRYLERYGDHGGLCDWTHVPDIEPRIPALLEYCSAQYAEREVMVIDDERITYGELGKRSAQLARQLLDAGIGKGTRVALLLPNGIAFIVTWFAVTRIGAIAVPISTLSQGYELKRTLRHADAHLLIAAQRFLSHDYVERLESTVEGLREQRGRLMLPELPYLRAVWIWGDGPPAWASSVVLERRAAATPELLSAVESDVTPGDPLTIIYTSGSTAEPKGVLHSHGNFVRQAAKLAASFPPFLPQDRVFVSMPLFWVGGMAFMLLNIMSVGATFIGSNRTGTEALDFAERENMSYFMGWPHLARAMAADPSFAQRKFPAMRGGSLFEALPATLRPPDPTLKGSALGMTESTGPHTIEHRGTLPEHLRGSFGRPMPGVEHRILDVDTGEPVTPGQVGVLRIRGDVMMLGLVKRERSDAFDADGWYDTGDLCSFRDGHLFFHGRADDMIKSAGANVSPKEVEAVLMALPGVVQAIVSGVKDSARGAVVGAVVVPRPGALLKPEELRRQAARMLSSYKVPRVILLIEAARLPMGSSSKLDRRALLGLLQEEYAKQASR